MNRKNLLLSHSIHDASHCSTCAGEANRKMMRGTSKTKMELGKKKATNACKVDDMKRNLIRTKLYNILHCERELPKKKAWKRARNLERAIFLSHRYDPQGYVVLYKIVCSAHRVAKEGKEEDLDRIDPSVLPLVCTERAEFAKPAEARDRGAEEAKKTTQELVEEIVTWRGGLEEEIECMNVCHKCCGKTAVRRKRLGLASDGSDDPEKMPYGDVVYWMVQTRSRDEPATTFYRCRKSGCGHAWKQ